MNCRVDHSPLTDRADKEAVSIDCFQIRNEKMVKKK
jgi:hypothetical protein